MGDIVEVKSFEDILEPILRKRRWYELAFWTIRWKLEDALRSPKTLYRAVKRFIQRGRRGWADEDVWNLDHYLSGVIAGTLKHLADTSHSYPLQYGDFDSWRTTLLVMAGVFAKYHSGEQENHFPWDVGCFELTEGDWDCMGRIFPALWD